MASIGSDNGFAPFQFQAIILINTCLFLIGPMENISLEFESTYINFHTKKDFKNVPEIPAILSWFISLA